MRVAKEIYLMRFIVVFLLLLFGTVSLSSADLYKWVDEKGIVHFTDDLMRVPQEYLPQIERREVTESDVSEGKTKVENGPVSKKEEDGYRDRLGRSGEYWKGRINEYQMKLKSIQEKIEDLREKYNGLTEKHNQSKSSAERVNLRQERDQVKEELGKLRTEAQEIKTILEKKIPEEAELYKAKPEWIKQ